MLRLKLIHVSKRAPQLEDKELPMQHTQLLCGFYAMNWCVSQWNGRDTTDVMNFFISRPGGLTHEKV